ncbi:reverse transcriptase domain-containing protein [Tanacetum coccineum]
MRGEVAILFKALYHIYRDFKRKGILAFKEDDHVRRGEERSPQVFRAIEQSTFLVAIFSDGFASLPSTIRVEYEWVSPRGHVLDECSKKIDLDVLSNLKKPTQAIRGIPVDEDDCGYMNSASTQEPEQVEGSRKKDINTSINKNRKLMLDGKLILVDDDGKPLNKVDSDPIDSDSESKVEVADDEIAQFMASGGENDARLYEDEDYDIYDTYDLKGLTK